MNLFLVRFGVVIAVIVDQATAAVRGPLVTRTRVVSTSNDASIITPAPIVNADDLRRRGSSSQICGYISSYYGKKQGYKLETLIPPACSDGYTCDVDSRYRVVNCADGHGGYTRPFNFGQGPAGFVRTCQDNSSPFAVSTHGNYASSIEDGTLLCGNGLPYCNKVTWTDMSASAWTCDASTTLSYASGNFLRSSITPSLTLPSFSVPTVTGGSYGTDVNIDTGEVLSNAAIKAIAIAVAIVGAFLIALAVFCWHNSRRKKKMLREADTDQPEAPVTKVVPITDEANAIATARHDLRPHHGVNLARAVPFRLYVRPAPPTDPPATQTESTQLPKKEVPSTTDKPDQNIVSTDTPDQNKASTDTPDQNIASKDTPDQNLASTDAPGQKVEATSPAPVSNPTSPQQQSHASWLQADDSPSPLTSDTHHFPGRWLWDPQHRR